MADRSYIACLETEIAGLQALISRRESQVGNKQHEGSFSDTAKHIEAARKTLRDKAIELIVLRCNAGIYDPVEIIQRANTRKWSDDSDDESGGPAGHLSAPGSD